MPNLLASVVDQWLTTFDLQAVRDILLEFLAFIAFVFLLIVIIFAMIKAPMLIGHGSIEMGVFVLLGLTHSVMNMLDEFVWFTSEFYTIWKLIKDLCLLVGAIVLMVGFFRFFIFSARLFGTEPEKDEKGIAAVAEDFTEVADIEEVPTEDEVVEEVEEETLEDILVETTDDDVYEDPVEVITEEIAEETTIEEPETEIVEETLEDVLEDTTDQPVDDVIEDIDEAIAETTDDITELDFTEETVTEETPEPEIDYLEELEEEAEEEQNSSNDTEFS